MNENEALMTRARRVNPVPPNAFQNLARSSEAQETLDAILHAPLPAGPKDALRPRALPRSSSATSAPRRTLSLRAVAIRTAAAVAAAVVVLGVVYVATPDRQGQSGDKAWAAELVRIAERSPRLLIGPAGWKVTGADELSGEVGEMMFATSRRALLPGASPGEYWMALNWSPAELHADYVKDRKRAADASWKITVAGHEAVLFQHKGTAPIGNTFYALWRDDRHSLELRSDVIPTVDEFRAVAASVHVVDVDTWLSAMPASVVKPDERGDAIDKILADIPVPSNVDVEELRNRQTVSNSVKYEVTTAIVCGWVKQWMVATKSGDGAARQEAVEAMAGTRHWAAFQESGQYESYVFDVADAMATNAPIDAYGSLPTGVGYQRHLGCPEG